MINKNNKEKILIFDTYNSLCNQMCDIFWAINFCLNYNIKFSFRYASIRENNIFKFINFNELFNETFLNNYDLYIKYSDIKNTINESNSFNFYGTIKFNKYFDKNVNIYKQINVLSDKYIYVSKFHRYTINKIKILDDKVYDKIMPTERLLNIYNDIKNLLSANNITKYNLIQYKKEYSIKNKQKKIKKPITYLLKKIKFKISDYKILLIGKNIDTSIGKEYINDELLNKIVYIKDYIKDYIKGLNYEEITFIDFLISKNSEEFYGYINSYFAYIINFMKKKNKYYYDVKEKYNKNKIIKKIVKSKHFTINLNKFKRKKLNLILKNKMFTVNINKNDDNELKHNISLNVNNSQIVDNNSQIVDNNTQIVDNNILYHRLYIFDGKSYKSKYKNKYYNLKKYIMQIDDNYIDYKNIDIISQKFNLNKLIKIDNINDIDKFILIVNFTNDCGGVSSFLTSILMKYKLYTNFLIIRKNKEKDNIEITVNDEKILTSEYTDTTFNDFLINNKIKITKIFINNILGFSYDFINSLFNLNIPIITITHDHSLIYKKPQNLFNDVNDKNFRKNNKITDLLDINKFDTIITQDIKNLNIFSKYINKNKNVIISKLPDFRYGLNKIKTNNKKIVIGIIGVITEIKGRSILEKLFIYFKQYKNIQFIVFGICDIQNINSESYNTINDFNKLLLKYKPNILLELSIWPETYSYAITLGMITRLPILCYRKNQDSVIEDRLKKYMNTHYFETLQDFKLLIKKNKQNYLYTINPNLYYTKLWDKLFINNNA